MVYQSFGMIFARANAVPEKNKKKLGEPLDSLPISMVDSPYQRNQPKGNDNEVHRNHERMLQLDPLT